MHLRRRAFGRKAVSPLLATIILIAITVAAGLVIYNVFFSTAGTMSQQLNVQPTSVDIVKAGTITLVSATIKNNGNKPITSCNVTVWGDSGTATLDLGALDVGQSKSASTTNPSDFSVTVGKAYPVKVDAAAADGSTFSKSFTVTCTG
jgi:flagellin-like protein